jgi:hypothetical protein
MSFNFIYNRNVALFLFVAGTLINILVYGSIQPLLVLVIYLLIIIFFAWLAASDEKKAFLFVFLICWFWAGISAIYANYFLDFFQTNSDASNFYDLASGNNTTGLTIDQISIITTGAGAVILWKYFYVFFDFLGFDQGRYIGILLNVTFVASTVVIGIKIVKEIFGKDKVRISRFVLLFSLCGTFWLFAAIHLRDSSVLFGITFLVLIWVRFLQSSTTWKLIQLILSTFLGLGLFALLRREFIFVPFAMLAAGFVALLMGAKKRKSYIRVLVGAFFLILPIVAYFISSMGIDAVNTLLRGSVGYKELSANMSESGSLGTLFISNQPLLIRLPLSIIYLFVFPIPFWAGFQLESSYHLFKSFHVIYMYTVTPLFALGIWKIIRTTALRTAPILFLLFITIGFIISIAYTSVETRHFGAFLVPLFVLSLVPDISEKGDRRIYHNLLKYFLFIIIIGHLIWAFLKIF